MKFVAGPSIRARNRLRRLNGAGILEKYPNLIAYVAHGEARPAYQRAFEAQLAILTGR